MLHLDLDGKYADILNWRCSTAPCPACAATASSTSMPTRSIMDAGSIALKRGLLVYCIEEIDNPGGGCNG